MWWVRDLTVTKGTTRSTPVELEAKLTLGTIDRLIVIFPPGCLGYVHVTLVHHEHQFFPADPDGSVAADDYVLNVPMAYDLVEMPARIKVVAWNTASTYDHTITIGVLVRKESTDRIKNALRALFVGGS